MFQIRFPFAVGDESPQATRFACSIHTKKQGLDPRF